MRIHRKLVLGALVAIAPLGFVHAQESRGGVVAERFSAEELDNLVAPIALYPDAILAQVLIAATFPDQLLSAARYVRANGTRGIDDQTWDVSVKAVAHYPPVLNMLAEREDWTTALGQAYASESGDVMEAVQRLRHMARAQGNLESTPQHSVVVDRDVIRIEPAQPRVIYVPTYNPEIVYYQPMWYAGIRSAYWSFGIGFPIGSWLSYDCDWYGRRVYYDGWRGGGWRVVAYPYVVINRVYVHPRYEVVYVNRDVVHRRVNYVNLRTYNTVHRRVTWVDRRRSGGTPGPIPRDRGDARNDDRDDNRGRRDDDRGRVGDPRTGRDDDRGRVGDPRTGRDDDRGRVGDPRGGREPDRRGTVTSGPTTPKPAIGRTEQPTRTRPELVRPTAPAPRTAPAPERQSPPRGAITRSAPTRTPPAARQAPPTTRQSPPVARESKAGSGQTRSAPAPSKGLSRSSAQRSKGSEKRGN